MIHGLYHKMKEILGYLAIAVKLSETAHILYKTSKSPYFGIE